MRRLRQAVDGLAPRARAARSSPSCSCSGAAAARAASAQLLAAAAVHRLRVRGDRPCVEPDGGLLRAAFRSAIRFRRARLVRAWPSSSTTRADPSGPPGSSRDCRPGLRLAARDSPVPSRREGRGLRIPIGDRGGSLDPLRVAGLSNSREPDVFRSDYVRRIAILLLIFLGALPLLRLQGRLFRDRDLADRGIGEQGVQRMAGGRRRRRHADQVRRDPAAAVLRRFAHCWSSLRSTIWRLLRSRYGVALTAVRDDEEARASVGVDVRRIKMVVFLIAGPSPGFAAGLYYMDAVIITPPARSPSHGRPTSSSSPSRVAWARLPGRSSARSFSSSSTACWREPWAAGCCSSASHRSC